MGETTHSIEINAPLRVVYNQWTQFEEFPRFMEGVEEVRQDGPKNLFWTARIAGKEKRWEAEILEQVPDNRIVWQSVDGTPNRGEVAFEPLDDERTRVTLTMEYEPEGFLEKAGDALGIPSGRAEGDLKRFRDFIEEGQNETGRWRGRIEPGESQSPDHTSAGIQEENSSVTTQSTSTVTPEAEIVRFPALTPIHPAGQSETGNWNGRIEPGENPDHASVGTQEESPSVADKSTSTIKPEFEPEPYAAPTKLYPEGVEDSSPKERSTDVESVSPPAPKELLGTPDEPQFYRDPVFIVAPTEEEIAKRAYELYLERGQVPGYEVENWLQAEKELSEKSGATH